MNKCAGIAILLLALAHAARGALPGEIGGNGLKEIGAVLQEKASWTPAQRKLNSHLIHVMKLNRGETYAPGAPHMRTDVPVLPGSNVVVDIKANVTPELLGLIQQNGGNVLSSYPKFHAIRATVSLTQLERLAASPDVNSIRPAEKGEVRTGSVESEGDITHLAAAARATYGVSGQGVNVGVLSDSVDYLTNSQATGDLGTVTVLSGQSGVPGTGEGTAMLEIVHDLAPDAQLFFATAGGSLAGFAQNIINLRNAGCDIIIDDFGYFSESPFQDAEVAQAVNTVTQEGALYFSSAGNSGNLDSGTSGTWEGDFVDGGAAGAPIAGTENGRVHNFGLAKYNTVLPGGSELHADLFWSDPLGAATDDYDLFVLDSTGSSVLASSTSTQDGTQDPYEYVSTLNVGEQLVIVKFAGVGRFLHLDSGRGILNIVTSGTTGGHCTTTNAFCVAAVDVATAYPNAFTGGSTNPVETFSSDGPRHVFFNADGSAMTPGNFSSTGGAIRAKPDLTAADGVSVSVPGFTPFYGTSAAAPHAGAIAALLKSYNPNLSPAEMRAILTSATLDIMEPGPDRDSGAGIIMANLALAAAPPDGLLITPSEGFTATGPAGGPLAAASEIIVLTNTGGTALNWSATSTAEWLNVSPRSGTLLPGGMASSVTASLNFAASNLAAGIYPATVWFTNLGSGLGQSRQFTVVVTVPPSPEDIYAGTISALGPVAYWRLNETNQPPSPDIVTNSGTLGASANGRGYDGVLQGEPGIEGTSFRFFNAALEVTYFGTHVDVPYNPVLNPSGAFTVEFWVMPAQLTSDLFCPLGSIDATLNGGNSRSGWLFYQNSDNTWQFRVGGLSGYTATLDGGTAQANVWQHIVGVYDGVNASLYVNAQLVAGPTSASGFAANTEQPFRIGATTLPNRTYDGWLDEVAFYTNALSGSDILAHYNSGISSSPGYAALVLSKKPAGYWHLDEPFYAAPPSDALPLAINTGSLAPNAHGIYNPGTQPGVPGVTNAGFGPDNLACQFIGANGGAIDVPETFLNFTGPLTLVAWVKANAAGGNYQTILSKGSASFRLEMDGGGLPHFGMGAQPSGDVIGAGRIDDGKWHELAGTYNGASNETLYVDGRSAASVNNATNVVNGNTDDFWIGGDPDTSGQLFNGVIDEVAIFTNALVSEQVLRTMFTATNPPPVVRAGSNGVALHTVVISWNSVAGLQYQLQVKTNLNQAAWSNYTTLTATGTTSGVTFGLTNRQEFFRVGVVAP